MPPPFSGAEECDQWQSFAMAGTLLRLVARSWSEAGIPSCFTPRDKEVFRKTNIARENAVRYSSFGRGKVLVNGNRSRLLLTLLLLAIACGRVGTGAREYAEPYSLFGELKTMEACNPS